jgi:putative transposase
LGGNDYHRHRRAPGDGRWLNNRAENSHQPFRRRERAMAKFRSAKMLQKFTSIHVSFHNHFYQECHLHSRQNFKVNRSAPLAEWRQITARTRRDMVFYDMLLLL